MSKRHIDLTGLPRHLHNRLRWYGGTPMLFLEIWPGPAFKDIEHWAWMNKVKTVYPRGVGPDLKFVEKGAPVTSMSKGKKKRSRKLPSNSAS